MHIAIIAAVFPIIFVGELPDKTMFASLVLSTRGKPLSVWIGAAGAFLIHVVIAVTIGGILFHLVPHRVLEGIVAFMFLVGAVLAIREARKEAQEEEIIVKGGGLGSAGGHHRLPGHLPGRVGRPDPDPHGQPGRPLSLAAFGRRRRRARPVGRGRPGRDRGQSLLRVINIRTVRIVTAVVLFVLAGLAAWEALK